MFFTRIAAIIAWILFVLGAFRAILAFIIAVGTDDLTDNAIASRRYFGTENTGAAIDEGMMILAVGVVLGVLVEISRAVNTKGEE